jgi:hypothetical protein
MSRWAGGYLHFDLPHLTWSGPPIDDEAILERLTPDLVGALWKRNGCVVFRGGLHIRGACLLPDWHSLRAAMEGADAFAQLYPAVLATDIPFAEDALGDQFLLRNGEVLRLDGETGELHHATASLPTFMEAIITDPSNALNMNPAALMAEIGGQLEPGKLVSVYPPFVVAESQAGVSFRAIPALERRRWLADLARQLEAVPDGTHVEIRVVP